jgi:two-component system phosphate regulon sensor histidine kinase PhoR
METAEVRSTEKPRVLVVDDERMIRDACERILVRMGCDVVKASQGEEALNFLKESAFSVVLLDLMMPGIEGLKVLNVIRQFWPDTMVIVITGYATLETAIEAMKRGAYGFIPKPFKGGELRTMVSRAIERTQLLEDVRRMEQEQRRTLKDLDAEKSRARSIVLALPDGVAVTDPEGIVVLVNPAFLRLVGLDPDTGPGQPLEAYVSNPELCRQVEQVAKGLVRNGTGGIACEFSPREDVFLLAQVTPVLSEAGECLGAVTVLVDISHLKRLDQVKSAFVAHVSHELRSPLSTIQQQLAFVLSQMDGQASQEQKTLLARAKDKTAGLISLIGDLLDLSRIEAGLHLKEHKPVSLEELLKGVTDFLSSRAGARGQTLLLELPQEKLPLVDGDPLALESVFGNLITNAIQYTQEGGEIRVQAGYDGQWIRVAVRDNGIGIEEKYLEKIFERFFRVKNDKTRHITGTGLGLAIVKGIVESLGGSVTVESRPGQGSTFTVLLPPSLREKAA